MGSLSNPTVLQAGSSIGQFTQSSASVTNYILGASAIATAAVWPAAAGATSNSGTTWDNGFAVTEVAAVNGIADYISRSSGVTPWILGSTAYSFAIEVRPAQVAAVSPQSRIELRLTGGVAQTFNVDFNSATGQLVASSGVIGNLSIVPFIVPKLGAAINVTIYRISFTFVTNLNNSQVEVRCYPRSDGGAGLAGGCIFGGPLLEDYVTSPSAFVPTSVSQNQTRPVGTIPHQLVSPSSLVRLLPIGAYSVDRYADQGATLVCGVFGAYTINFTADTRLMPIGTEITITRSLAGGAITLNNLGVFDVFYYGITAYSTFTFGDANFPGVQSVTLRKVSATDSAWAIVSAAANNSASVPLWRPIVTNLSYLTFAAPFTQVSLNLFQLPIKGVLHSLLLKHSVAFTGGAVSACVLSMGINGALTKYSNQFDVFQAPGNQVFQLSSGPFAENSAAATQVLIDMNTTGANTNALTQGAVDIYALQSTWA